jgi:nifR3 family TIM-barrel protein
MREATKIASAAKPDLIDINYGCPVKNVACRGAGASLLQDIDRMVLMTRAVVESTHLPVTVKTRLGWDDNTKNIYEVAERLQDVGIQALTIHGRTRAQMYKGEADWTLIREIKRNPRIKIPIFGNGDVNSIEKAASWRMEYEIDGIMIGRAAIGYPWIFREIKHFFKTGEYLPEPTISERVNVCRTHFEKSILWKG